MMTLSELIAYVGDDNVQFQNLDADCDSITSNGKVARFTLRTDPKYAEERARGEPKHIAFVVWIPKHLLPSDFIAEKETW